MAPGMRTDAPSKWFRMYAEFSHDPKVQKLSEANQRRYLMLLCMRCSNGDPLSDIFVAGVLGIEVEQAVTTKAALTRKGLIADGWVLANALEIGFSSRPPLSVWKKIKQRIFLRDDFTCRYCGARGVRLECDHVVPVLKGGGEDDANLVTACGPCNRSKGAKDLSQWMGVAHV